MKELKSMFGTAIGFFMVVAFSSGIIGLVVSQAAVQLPGLKALGNGLRCIAGIPEAGSSCVNDKLTALEAERRAIAAERQRLGDEVATQNLVFIQGSQLKDGFNLVVGALFADATRRAGLIRAYCWVVIDNTGLDPRVSLAALHSDGRTEAIAVDVKDQALLEMSASDIEAARSSCPFPDVN